MRATTVRRCAMQGICAHPPGPRRIQVRCRLSSQPPMPPRARASRAPKTAPGCAAARSSAPPLSDHRSSRVVAGDTAELACQRMGGCISHANAAAISAQPALRLTARCPSAFSRRCEGYCGTRRRRCGDYPAQPGTTPRPGAPPPASAAAGHRRCHASIAPRARSAPAEHLVLADCAAVRLLCATAWDAAARLCAAAACVRGDEGAATPVFSSPLLD